MKNFLVQYDTFAKWQPTITAEQYNHVIAIEERTSILEPGERHSITILQPNNPHAKLLTPPQEQKDE